MGCWYSKCRRGPKKRVAAAAEEAVEVTEVNNSPGGGGGDAEELSSRTSIANENPILPNEGEQCS